MLNLFEKFYIVLKRELYQWQFTFTLLPASIELERRQKFQSCYESEQASALNLLIVKYFDRVAFLKLNYFFYVYALLFVAETSEWQNINHRVC